MDALYLTNYNGRPLSHHADYAATYAGQVARWVHEFLNATDVSIQDIISDIHSAGAHHDPGFFLELLGTTGFTDEKRLEFVMQVLRPKALKAWNMLFDQHNLDTILVPGFFHTPTMACGAAKTCAHRVLDLTTGVVETVGNFSAMDNVMPSHMNKHVPLPKVMVPVGKDVEGKPVALQFMGRAGPVGARDLAYAFDDELLRGLDVPFLRDVDVLVEAMVAEDPSLARVAPEMVTRDLA